jgi:ABC-2 type transport system permease protein
MNLTKVAQIATRDFVATVSTRGFIIGLLLTPTFMTLGFVVVPRLVASQRARPLIGQVAVVDQTGRVGGEISRALGHDAIEARRTAAVQQAQAAVPEAFRQATANATARALGDAPELTVVQRPASSDRAADREWLLDRSGPPHLAVVVVPPEALQRTSGSEYGGYDVYVPVNADARIEGAVYDGVREALVAVRAGDQGVAAANLEAMLQVTRPRSVEITAEGVARPSNPGFSRSLPFILMALLLVTVMVGGQGLLTTTIEEKSSRVVEVMLSAVSPLELMTGKLLGQMAVGLVAVGLYIVLGLTALTSFAMLGMFDMSLIGYLLIFFMVSYLLMGSFMLAIGAAVNEMREAQSLMMPVTLTMVLPWFFAAPILQNPSSTFATVISFVPPVNLFAMLLRLTSTAPPPAWQAWLTIGIGIAAAAAGVWCAAKIYRIGLLMYGKPPDFATLMRWVRAA